ncbi:hypothetical protein ACHHYP_04862 [Achlya hypogyna]|uniref:Uncharacterized protein n=1 Tax=Achlya hypogyna TaxID=1202772 RepID=A0A1V9YZN5_ACHHY|nr:hypothetical protein ACHHYP_04862 [Achlya hypogyna]
MVFRAAAPPLDEELQEKLALPGFDVASHELIEQRLENLKRKPTVVQWLDSYVRAVEAEADEDDDDWQPRRRPGSSDATGFLGHLFWALIAVACSPIILLLCSPFQRFHGPGTWPLDCQSPLGFVRRGFMNLVTLGLILLFAFVNLTQEMPTWAYPEQSLELAQASALVLREKVITCAACVRVHDNVVDVTQQILSTIMAADHDGLTTLKPPIEMDANCTEPALQLAGFGLLALLLIYFYSRATRFALGLLLLARVVTTSQWFHDIRSLQPQITGIDPSFALVDEEIVISMRGVDLANGGTVAWIPYWCSSSTFASPTAFGGDCAKQYSSTFTHGVVLTTFTTVETYIPCYKPPNDPTTAYEYRCFAGVRLRVKEANHIPGLVSSR